MSERTKSMHGGITVMLAEKSSGSAWAEWIAEAQSAEGFVDAQLSGGFWLVRVEPSSPAAQVVRRYLEAQSDAASDPATLWGWRGGVQ